MIYNVTFSVKDGGKEYKFSMTRTFLTEDDFSSNDVFTKDEYVYINIYVESNLVKYFKFKTHEIEKLLKKYNADNETCYSDRELTQEILTQDITEKPYAKIIYKLFRAFAACNIFLIYAIDTGHHCNASLEKKFVEHVIKQFNRFCYETSRSLQIHFLEKSEHENLDAQNKYEAGHLHKIEVEIGNNEEDCKKLINYYSLKA